MVEIYYDSDETVQKDVEIQEFVKDVSFGMNNSDSESVFVCAIMIVCILVYSTCILCVSSQLEMRAQVKCTLPLFTEFPKSLKTREELAEYLTVVIFTASAQHAAVNFGQVRLHTTLHTTRA